MRRSAAALAVALLASCAPRPAPAPVPPAESAPPRVEEPPPPAPPLAWEDAPLSEGDWDYRADGAAPAAAFGTPRAPKLVVRCSAGRVRLARADVFATGSLTVHTTTGARVLPANAGGEGLVAELDPSDPLLDAIVFSRGRFAVEAAGAPPLVIPTWPEPARVIEDCRG